jgi:hypothetical protein
VTVPAIETELADMELVAVRDGLNGPVADVRVPWRKEVPDARDSSRGSESTGQGGDEWELIPPRGEYLGQ